MTTEIISTEQQHSNAIAVESKKNFLTHLKSVSNVLSVSKEIKFFYIPFTAIPNKYIIHKTDFVKSGGSEDFKCPGAFINNYNELYYIIDDETDYKELMYLTLHEIVHALFNHQNRLGNRDPIIWQLACDQYTNGLLYNMNRDITSSTSRRYYKFTENTFFDEELHNGTTSNQKVEEIYNIFYHRSEDFSVNSTNVPGQIPSKYMSQGSGSGGDNSPLSGNDIEEAIENNQNNLPEPEDDNTSDDQENSNYDDYSKYAEQYKQSNDHSRITIPFASITDKKTGKTHNIILDATQPENSNTNKQQNEKNFKELEYGVSAIWHNSPKMRGVLPGNIIEVFDELFSVNVPWEDIFQDSLLYSVAISGFTSWTTPNIYYRNAGFILPGPKNDSLGLKTLVMGIDTSGSIRNKDIKKFFNVVIAAGEFYEKIIVYVHDHEVADIIEIEGFEDNHVEIIFEKLKEHGVKGRGGTSHQDLFDKIEVVCEDENVSSIIFLTDFESDIASICDNYKFLKDNTTIWVIVSNSIDIIDFNNNTEIAYKAVEVTSDDEDSSDDDDEYF